MRDLECQVQLLGLYSLGKKGVMGGFGVRYDIQTPSQPSWTPQSRLFPLLYALIQAGSFLSKHLVV